MKPINRERFLELLLLCGFDSRNARSIDPQTARAAVDLCARKAEWFDFGALEYSTLGKAAKDALPFRLGGYMVPPYPFCMMRTRLYRNHPVTGVEAAVDALIMIASAPTANSASAVLYAATGRGIESSDAISWVFLAQDDRMDLIGIFHIRAKPPADPEVPKGRPYNPDVDPTSETIYDALWLILNTKGIRKTVEEPSEKLNRARVKNGKVPLQRVTRIDAAQYMRAMQETESMERGGTHASPRMHLRRAHLRHYTADRFSETVRARPVIIDAMIINADKDVGVPRDHYEVIHKRA